jgi:hypothetical protein
MPIEKHEKRVKVRVLHNQVVYTHPQHADGLRAPDAETLAAQGGVETASARAHHAGETLTVPAHVAAELEAAGSVERV